MKIVADNTVPFLKGIAEPIAEVKYLTSKEFTPENVQDHLEELTGMQCRLGRPICAFRIGHDRASQG